MSSGRKRRSGASSKRAARIFGYEGNGGVVVVCAFGPGARAKHRPRSFEPHRQTTDARIRRVWAASEQRYRFLGSWHTHPRGRAAPSTRDVRTASEMAEQDDLRLPAPLLVIQATRGIREVALAELRAWRWAADVGGLAEMEIRLSGWRSASAAERSPGAPKVWDTGRAEMPSRCPKGWRPAVVTFSASKTLPQHHLRHVRRLARWQSVRFRSGLLRMPPAGLEPATRCLEGSRSDPLSYGGLPAG